MFAERRQKFTTWARGMSAMTPNTKHLSKQKYYTLDRTRQNSIKYILNNVVYQFFSQRFLILDQFLLTML